ncbi:MAG: cytochrome-c oxidase, cbb3-type subunit III [Betaproteobacteria bacterium]
MSDFSSVFWDYYILIITVVSVVGCAVFLWTQSKTRVAVGPDGKVKTTGHVWDGDLADYDNPLPRWWMWLFYLTVAFSLVYLALFPGLGTKFGGLLGWTSTGQWQAEVKAADAKFGPLFAQYAAQPLEQVARDKRAVQMGERIYLNNCAQCHGTDARGARGFPNLADNVWFWGGAPEQIKVSIVAGRNAQMPPMAAALGSPEDVTDVAHYALSLSNSTHDPVRAARGKEKFAACAGCHGIDGKGNPAIGARNLTEGGWLHGRTVAAITEGVNKGRYGVMPAFKGILTEPEIHLVSAYLLSLSQSPGATAPAAAPAK